MLLLESPWRNIKIACRLNQYSLNTQHEDLGFLTATSSGARERKGNSCTHNARRHTQPTSSRPPASPAFPGTACSRAHRLVRADACCARERTWSPVPLPPSQADHGGFAKSGRLGLVLSAWVSTLRHSPPGARSIVCGVTSMFYVGALVFSSLKGKDVLRHIWVRCCGLGRGLGCFAEARLRGGSGALDAEQRLHPFAAWMCCISDVQ